MVETAVLLLLLKMMLSFEVLLQNQRRRDLRASHALHPFPHIWLILIPCSKAKSILYTLPNA